MDINKTRAIISHKDYSLADFKHLYRRNSFNVSSYNVEQSKMETFVTELEQLKVQALTKAYAIDYNLTIEQANLAYVFAKHESKTERTSQIITEFLDTLDIYTTMANMTDSDLNDGYTKLKSNEDIRLEKELDKTEHMGLITVYSKGYSISIQRVKIAYLYSYKKAQNDDNTLITEHLSKVLELFNRMNPS